MATNLIIRLIILSQYVQDSPAVLSESNPNNSHSFDMKMQLSVSLGAEEIIWHAAEWCAASNTEKKGKERK